MLELGGNKLGEEGWSSGEKGNGEFRKAGRAWKRIRMDGLLAMGPAKFAKRPRENRDDYTGRAARCDAMRERNERERREGRGERGRKRGRKEEGKKYSIKRNGGLANIYLWVGREKRKEPCENVPSRMALVAAQKRGKFS